MNRLAEEARALVVGIDVGGTKTLAALYDDTDVAIVEVQRRTPADGGQSLMQFLTDVVQEVAVRAGASVVEVDAVGVGLPGVVDPEAGTLRHAVNLGIGDDPVDVSGPLSLLIDGPVRVANDVNLAAVGAAEVLGLRGDVAYLSIGTGLALGLVLRGELHHGATGTAGEIGHLPIDPYGPVCECGQRGCLEVVVSGRAIARRWPVENGSGDVPVRVPAGHEAVSDLATKPGRPVGADLPGRAATTDLPLQPATAMLNAAAAGDPRAIAVRDDVCDHLARAVSLIAQTVDPDVIVLGGGVAEAGDLLLDELRRALDRRGERSAFVAALNLADRVVMLPPGAPAGAIGAAQVARSSIPQLADER